MTMLGAETISIEIGGETFELRPSLRACMRLVRRLGLPALAVAIRDFNITVIMDVLREAAIKPALLLNEIAAIGLGTVRNRLAEPLAQFVLAVAGIDPDDTTASAPSSGKPMTPEQYHARLFEIATGWLAWAPEQAWNATPAEIIAAKAGRTDLITDVLKAVFGTADDNQPSTPALHTTDQLAELVRSGGLDPAFDREGLRALKAKMSA